MTEPMTDEEWEIHNDARGLLRAEVTRSKMKKDAGYAKKIKAALAELATEAAESAAAAKVQEKAAARMAKAK